MELKVIAYARNGHTDKFGIPRQSREESPIVTRIVFEPDFAVPEALRGIEGFSHLWILWGFSEVQRDHVQGTKDWSPTVRPPRLGGNKRVGVFATRSPFRPNPIGLSSVKLLKIKTPGSGTKTLELLVSGADVLDGTPIYDIKPYLSFSDSHPEAQNGFAEETKDYQLEVDWSAVEKSHLDNDSTLDRGSLDNVSTFSRHSLDLVSTLSGKRIGYGIGRCADWMADVSYILRQDPRPGYQDDPKREYKLDYKGRTVTFCVKGQRVFVKKVEPTEQAEGKKVEKI